MTLSEYSVISRAVEHYGVNSQINMLASHVEGV